MTKALVQAG